MIYNFVKEKEKIQNKKNVKDPDIPPSFDVKLLRDIRDLRILLNNNISDIKKILNMNSISEDDKKYILTATINYITAMKNELENVIDEKNLSFTHISLYELLNDKLSEVQQLYDTIKI